MTSPIQLEAFEQIKALVPDGPAEADLPPGREPRRSDEDRKAGGQQPHLGAPEWRVACAAGHPVAPSASAFAVPYELLQGERVFSIELEDGSVVELPYPMPSGSTPVVPTGTPAAGVPETRRGAAPMTPARAAAGAEQPPSSS